MVAENNLLPILSNLNNAKVAHVTGLALPPDLTYDQWESIGQAFQPLSEAIKWWRGDWLAYGEHRFGERYSQGVTEATGATYDTLRKEAWVATRVPFGIRIHTLTWSHHEVVAPINGLDAQTHWLNEAVKHGWSVRALRLAIEVQRASEYGYDKESEADHEDQERCPMCGQVLPKVPA